MSAKMKFAQEMSDLFRAKNTLLWVVTKEEVRAESAIASAAASAKFPVQFWDCSGGITSIEGKAVDGEAVTPDLVYARIKNRDERMVYVLRDIHKWLFDPVCLRGLGSLARLLQKLPSDKARRLVVLTPSTEVPPELQGHATVVKLPIPDRAEIRDILRDIISMQPPEVQAGAFNGYASDEAAVDAVVGLSALEAANCYARSLVKTKRIDVALVAGEKKRVIEREGVLTWYDADPRGLDAVGGLEVLKRWAVQRKLALTPGAREYGIQPPRGVFVGGISGCGKSEFAKALAAAWGWVLLRMDPGALKSKYVGESEANFRKALELAETISPVILWIDEFEKAFGAEGGTDDRTTTDQIGALLTWMQERKAPVCVVATANDVRKLPPEIMRKGRFDEFFFVDLPTTTERAAILGVVLKKHGRDPSGFDCALVAKETVGFTGAEIAALVPDAMFEAYADGGRPLETADIQRSAARVVPLSKTASDKVADLREWAKGRARNASLPEAVPTLNGSEYLYEA